MVMPVLCRRLIPLRPPSCRSTACSHAAQPCEELPWLKRDRPSVRGRPSAWVRVTKFEISPNRSGSVLAHKNTAVLLASSFAAAAPGVLAEFLHFRRPPLHSAATFVSTGFTTVTNVKADGDQWCGRVILVDTPARRPDHDHHVAQNRPVHRPCHGQQPESRPPGMVTSAAVSTHGALLASSVPAPSVLPRILTPSQPDGPALLFSSSDYLGLSIEPKVQQAMNNTVRRLV